MEVAAQFIDLGKYGPIGVILALIGLCAYQIYINQKSSTAQNKQLTHQLEVSNEIIRDNYAATREHTRVTEKLTNTVQSLERTIEHFIKHN
jgi:hypothetical protein